MALEIKICGLTHAADARLAVAAGADYVGFVLYAGSPRGMSADAFRRLRSQGRRRALSHSTRHTRQRPGTSTSWDT